jgi:hypothetical protein
MLRPFSRFDAVALGGIGPPGGKPHRRVDKKAFSTLMYDLLQGLNVDLGAENFTLSE